MISALKVPCDEYVELWSICSVALDHKWDRFGINVLSSFSSLISQWTDYGSCKPSTRSLTAIVTAIIYIYMSLQVTSQLLTRFKPVVCFFAEACDGSVVNRFVTIACNGSTALGCTLMEDVTTSTKLVDCVDCIDCS